MTDDEKLTLWVGATRYHLGRMTYAVHDFCDLLIRQWGNLPERAQWIIKRDVGEAFDRDDEAREEGRDYKPLGHDCDRAAWERVRRLWTDHVLWS